MPWYRGKSIHIEVSYKMLYYTYSGRSGTKMMFNFMDMTFYAVAVLPPPYMLEWPRNKARVLCKEGKLFSSFTVPYSSHSTLPPLAALAAGEDRCNLTLR